MCINWRSYESCTEKINYTCGDDVYWLIMSLLHKESAQYSNCQCENINLSHV